MRTTLLGSWQARSNSRTKPETYCRAAARPRTFLSFHLSVDNILVQVLHSRLTVTMFVPAGGATLKPDCGLDGLGCKGYSDLLGNPQRPCAGALQVLQSL